MCNLFFILRRAPGKNTTLHHFSWDVESKKINVSDHFIQEIILCASNQKSLSPSVLVENYPKTCEFQRDYRTLDKRSKLIPNIISMGQTMVPEIFLGASQSPQNNKTVVQIIAGFWPFFPFSSVCKICSVLCNQHWWLKFISMGLTAKSQPKTFQSSSMLGNMFMFAHLLLD